MQARHIRRFCPIDDAGQKLLEMVTDRLGLSARSYSRILKVARTIADLAVRRFSIHLVTVTCKGLKDNYLISLHILAQKR
jgi:predicted ATPase with chaperone activity